MEVVFSFQLNIQKILKGNKKINYSFQPHSCNLQSIYTPSSFAFRKKFYRFQLLLTQSKFKKKSFSIKYLGKTQK